MAKNAQGSNTIAQNASRSVLETAKDPKIKVDINPIKGSTTRKNLPVRNAFFTVTSRFTRRKYATIV
jgi:hypothetical protein